MNQDNLFNIRFWFVVDFVIACVIVAFWMLVFFLAARAFGWVRFVAPSNLHNVIGVGAILIVGIAAFLWGRKGPYEERICLADHYLPINLGSNIELVPVESITVKFYVENIDMREVWIHGEQIVKAILKDFSSKEVEYVKRSN